jgi:chromosome segregation ATPase
VKLNQQYKDGRSQIEEVRSSFESHKHHGQVLRSLMDQRDSGNIPGIHGRLVS